MENNLSENQSGTPQTIRKNIETILNLQKESQQKLSPVEHLADRVALVAGSTPFIIFHAIWFSGWIIVNKAIIPGITPFDPFPFSFLTLVVSLEAIFLTLLVLMSQNRMTKEADKRAHLDLQVDLLAEQETTVILRTVERIAEHLGLEEEKDEDIKDLQDATDIMNVAKIIDEHTKDK